MASPGNPSSSQQYIFEESVLLTRIRNFGLHLEDPASEIWRLPRVAYEDSEGVSTPKRKASGDVLRCKIRSYLTPNFSANFTDFRQLERAVSRLYRSRFLQPNTHFAAFFEIYKIIIPLHRSQFNILANFRRKVSAFFKISSKMLIFFTMFIGFCSDFDENFAEFRQIP